MKGAPRSEQFDDIYFSAENGLEETAYVFLKGNNLPQAWKGKENFTIAETGFGTGLNFFSVWKLFEETAEPNQTLDFISIEKYPLTPKEIKQALEPWKDFFKNRIDIFLAQYPLRIAGFHRIKISQQITITLIFDDVKEVLPKVDAQVDCWFLDGFTPAKNPDMWSNIVFQEMARLSKAGATYATFTAAGDVRRGLTASGFSVQKQKGFGRKREMIAGEFQGEKKILKPHLKLGARVAIIGGGLAGTSCAYVLKQYGYKPVIYEASDALASGASGNRLGLYNPRFSKLRDDLSDFFAPAYAHLIRTASQIGEQVDYTPCGALHLMNDSKKEERLKSMASHWLWHSDHVKILDTDMASEVAGIPLDCEALYLPDAGYISPQKLCSYYARDVDVHLNTKIDDLSILEEEAVILTCGAAVQNFDVLSWMSIEEVRGQVSLFKETEKSKPLKSTLCYGGYLLPSVNGAHITGSTFEKWVNHTDVTEENHQDNMRTLKDNIGVLEGADFNIQSGRAGLRAATNDRFPVVGAVPDQDHVYVSAAFGSHGLVGSITAAHYIVDLMRGGPLSLASKTAKSLSPQRFLDRARKRDGWKTKEENHKIGNKKSTI